MLIFTSGHGNSFGVLWEVAAVGNRQLLDSIVKMLAYWPPAMWAASLVERIDLNLHTYYFAQFAAAVDALTTTHLAFGSMLNCDTAAVERIMPCMTMHTNNERFRLWLSIVESVDCPMHFHCWSMVSVVVQPERQQ